MAVVGAVASLALVALGYAVQTQESRGALRQADSDDEDSAATRTSPRLTAIHAGSAAAIVERGPSVLLRNGLMTVRTNGAPLAEVLAAITTSAGVTFVRTDERGERVWMDLGPKPVREVVAAVLEQASYGYAFVDSPGGTDRAPALRVFLIRQGAPDLSGRMSVEQGSASASVWPRPAPTDEHSPAPDDSALKQQRAVDAMFDACKAQACDSS